MKATNLSRAIWNSIADLASRSSTPREVYFSEVVKVDETAMLIWAKDFGDVAIPLVAFSYAFAYNDTVPTGVAHDGVAVSTQSQRREDKTHTNPNLLVQLVAPRVGDLVTILDPWGAKRFPMAIGLPQNVTGAWTEGTDGN